MSAVFDLPTNETLEFVLKYLPDRHSRILEVGCGNGELAFALQNYGFQIVAIDSSAKAVETAKRLGVDAKVAEFPNFDEANFDAVLFTRSLHHIPALAKTVAKTHQILNSTGLVIVEDFAFDEADEVTIGWFYSAVSTLEVGKQLSLEDKSFVKDLLNGKGDYEVWRETHHHDLHPASIMFAELEKYFEPITETTAPYLYRYLCPLLDKNPNGFAIASQILAMEHRMAEIGKINLIGRRFVGRKLLPKDSSFST